MSCRMICSIELRRCHFGQGCDASDELGSLHCTSHPAPRDSSRRCTELVMSKGLRHLAPLDVTSSTNPAARVGWVSRKDDAPSKMPEPQIVLELQHISKQFGTVHALTDVSLDCRAGEIHAVVGENGSGKSTLLGIASGFVEPDHGVVLIGGKRLRKDSPAEARRLGLGMAYQDNSQVLSLSVKENLYLATPPKRRPRYWQMKKWAREILPTFELDLFPDLPTGYLTLAQRQLFEVAKAMMNDPKVLLLDEPTQALGPSEVEILHRTIRACAARGVGVVYVGHRLPEVLTVSDRITVLRDGRHQGTYAASGMSENDLVSLMIGRPFTSAFPPPTERPNEIGNVLSITGLQGPSFGPVNLNLKRGEIVGLAGAEGNGQAEFFK